MFVREVVREMTAKAGQKCTAIRRVIAPQAYCDALVSALDAKLNTIALGNPADEGIKMGPLASLSQREEVLSRIGELSHEAEIVSGNPDQCRLVSGDA